MTGAAALILMDASAAEPKLPFDSRDLLIKLQLFQDQQRAEAEATIAKRTADVIAILESHITRETKAGNLATANALNETVKRLKTGGSPTAGIQTTELAWLPGTEWEINRAGTPNLKLTISKTTVWAVKGKPFIYSISPNGELQYKSKQKKITLRFYIDHQTGSYVDNQGLTGTIKRISK